MSIDTWLSDHMQPHLASSRPVLITPPKQHDSNECYWLVDEVGTTRKHVISKYLIILRQWDIRKIPSGYIDYETTPHHDRRSQHRLLGISYKRHGRLTVVSVHAPHMMYQDSLTHEVAILLRKIVAAPSIEILAYSNHPVAAQHLSHWWLEDWKIKYSYGGGTKTQ